MASMESSGPVLPGTVPAYDLRVTIQDAEPPIWRRLQVPESLTVAEFHLAVQAAYGWEDCHLYAVRCLDRQGQPRVIVGPDREAEDLDAEPPSGVVLSELLDASKPRTAAMEYEYDFGDGWIHDVELLGPAQLAAGTIACVDGVGRGPVEDSGGPRGYREFVQILQDKSHAEYDDASHYLFVMTGEFAPYFDAAAFDPDVANRKLRLLSLRLWPQPLTDEERDAVLLPVRWLLEQASPDGLELTKEGYLKPALVKRAMDELGWSDPIMGKGNREINALPVLALRQHLMDWKLLRSSRGKLILSPRGRRGLQRPGDLWDYVADEIGRPKHDAVKLATRLYIEWHLSGIAPPSNRRVEVIRNALVATGFVTRSGHPIPESWAAEINQTVRTTLRCLNLLTPGRPRGQRAFGERKLLTDGGLKFLLEVERILAAD